MTSTETPVACTLFDPNTYAPAPAHTADPIAAARASCTRRARHRMALLDTGGITTLLLCDRHRRAVLDLIRAKVRRYGCHNVAHVVKDEPLHESSSWWPLANLMIGALLLCGALMWPALVFQAVGHVIGALMDTVTALLRVFVGPFVALWHLLTGW